MRQTETGLYEKLEELLKAADKPKTCVELFDLQEIRDLAASSNRVSDYLGHLWRRGKVTRSPAARTDNDGSRWAYSWRKEAQDSGQAEEIEAGVFVSKNKNVKHLDMQISYDETSVTIAMPDMTINIRRK